MFVKKENRLKKIILFPFGIIFSIVFVFGSVSLALFSLVPFFLYRKLIIVIAKWIMPGSQILATQDNALAKGNVYRQRDQYILAQWDFEGRINWKEFLEMWEERVMQKKRDGRFQFPEFKTYVEAFKGYSFFREDKKFDIKNHITVYKDPDPNAGPINIKKLDRIKQDFLHELFQMKRSPWKILIVNNYIKNGKEYSVIFNKAHHCLGDGYVGLLVFWNSLFLQKLEDLRPPKSAVKQNAFTKIVVIVSAAFDFFRIFFRKGYQLVCDQDKLFDFNSWHDSDNNSDRVYCTQRPIDTYLVKEISKGLNVSVTTVLLAISSGALRRMMIANGLEAPKDLRTVYSLPLPNHPDRLATHASVTQFMLNIKNSDDKKRLQSIEFEMKRAIRTVLLFGAHFGMFLLKCVPFSTNKFIARSKAGSTMFTATVPFPPLSSEDLIFLGCRLDAFYSTCEIIVYNLSASVNIVKYKQSFYFNYGIQKHLLKKEDDIYDIEKYVLEELHHLRTQIIV